jgi:glucosamine-6-phosphate deaminase
MAWGERKSNIIKASVEGTVTIKFLRHRSANNAVFCLDKASSKLARLIHMVEWKLFGQID